MLWKCCTQYAGKFGKLSSGYRTGKGQFSFQCQRKAMPKNAQTTAQLHSFTHWQSNAQNSPSQASTVHEPWTSGCSSWIYPIKEPEIKLPTSTGSLKKQESSRKTSVAALDYAKAFVCVYHNELWKILKEMGIPDHLTCLLRNLYADQEATVRTGHETTDWFQIRKGVCQGCILSPCLFNLHVEYIMQKYQAGWSTSWNQDCWEKYQ